MIARVVQVFAPSGTDGLGRHSSGVVLAPGLVLTARHSVEGCDGAQCLLAWTAEAGSGSAFVELAGGVRSMDLSGAAGHLLVGYAGEARPWPAEITVRDMNSGRHLSLKLVAVEPIPPAGSAGR